MELFFKIKVGVENVRMSLIKDLKAAYGIDVKYARCHNDGKKSIFKGLANRKGWAISSSTLHIVQHYKGMSREKFAILFHRIHAILNGGKFSPFLRNNLWAESAITANLLEYNLITPTKDSSPFQQILGKGMRRIPISVQKFNEMWIMTYHNTHIMQN